MDFVHTREGREADLKQFTKHNGWRRVAWSFLRPNKAEQVQPPPPRLPCLRVALPSPAGAGHGGHVASTAHSAQRARLDPV